MRIIVLLCNWVIVMNRFLSQPQFIRHFPSTENALIRTVGYDDFSKVKPLYTYRVQNFYTWHFVLSGAGTLEMDGKDWNITQGQMFYIPPGVKMRYFPNEEDPWEYVWFSLVGVAPAEYGKMLGFSIEEPVRCFSIYPGIVSRLNRLFASLATENSSVFSALSAFYGIMEACTSAVIHTGIRAVKKHLDESFTLPSFSVEQLCYDAGMSHAHLLRLFRQEYGTSVIRYVVSKRIALACELLSTTDLSVQSVAFSCGFSDEPHFMKTFKKYVGCSALQYRKKHMGGT